MSGEISFPGGGVTATGGLVIHGKIGQGDVNGSGVLRPDFPVEIQADGEEGSHAGIFFKQPRADDEIGIGGAFQLSDNSWLQTFGMFSGLYQENNSSTAAIPYWAIHNTGIGYDNTTFLSWSDASIYINAGGSENSPWHTRKPPSGWAFFGGAGVYAPSLSIGALTSTYNRSKTVDVGYSVSGATGYIQAYDHESSAFLPLQLGGSSISYYTPSTGAVNLAEKIANLEARIAALESK